MNIRHPHPRLTPRALNSTLPAVDRGHPIPLKSLGALRFKEWLCWSLAAFLALMAAVILSDAAFVGVILPALLAGFFAWEALRLRRLRAFLAALDWEQLQPRLAALRGRPFADAVTELTATACSGDASPETPVEISGSEPDADATAMIRPSLWVHIESRNTLVRAVRVSRASPGASAATARGLGSVLFLAALLIFFDAFLLDQGIVSLVIGFILIFVRLPFILLSRHTGLRLPRLRNLCIYLAAMLLVLGIRELNNRLARRRADDLIAAVRAYHVKHARYPQTLDELVPGFIDRIRPAKLTLADTRFRYVRNESGTLLYYTVLPPFGRRVYDFTDGTWTFRD